MPRESSGRKDARLLQILSAVILVSFVLGWGAVREMETRLLHKEAMNIALNWNRALTENLENVKRIVETGIITEHDRPLFRLAASAGGVVRYKVYNYRSVTVADSDFKDIGRINNSEYFRKFVRNGTSYVLMKKTMEGGGGRLTIAKAYVPMMVNGNFLGAFEVYVDVTLLATHAREVGNFAIGGLFLVLAIISGIGGFLIFNNTEHLRRQQEALQAEKEIAEKASLAKSEFLASMSHELRTPLNAINGFSEIIAGEHFGPVGVIRYREYAQNIHDSGCLLLSLINDILDMSKVEAEKLELHEEFVSMASIVDMGDRIMSDKVARRNISFSTEIENDLPALYCDKRLLTQVLLNLLSNAVKFTPQGGEVTVRASLVGEGSLYLVVEDTGVGIAPEDIPKVLEPFGQVDNSVSGKSEGTGLGLPLAKKFIELHGGRFDISSIVGKGTIVSARFPSSRILHET